MTNWIVVLFGGIPALYFSVSLLVFFAFLIAATLPGAKFTQKRGSDFVFLFLAGLTLFVWRWPSFFWQEPINPDEGLWVAAAIKATFDSVPWRGFDLGTSGPLAAYILTLPTLFGRPIDFFSTRLIGVCLLTLAIGGLYFSSKWLHGGKIARIAVVPAVVFLALTKDPNFLHFSSEIVPVCLTSIALAATVYLADEGRPKACRLTAITIAGLCIGSTGFAKLQSAPIALVLLAFSVTGIFWNYRQRWTAVRLEAVVLIMSLFAIPATIAVTVFATDQWQYATQVYLKHSIKYVGAGIHIGPSFLIEASPPYTVYLIASLIVCLAAFISLFCNRDPLPKRAAIIFIGSGLLLLASVFAIYAPMRPFPHYLLFSVVPLCWLTAGSLALASRAKGWQNRELSLVICYTSLFLIPAMAISMSSSPGQLIETLQLRPSVSVQALAIRRYAPRGSRIAVWGACPEYYVQTGTVMATRYPELGPYPPGPAREFYYDRYMRDLEISKPKVFVDAVYLGAFRYHDRLTQGHETFPALAAFVHKYYVLAEDVAGVRIFVMKDS